jgi:hypothetical protein
MSHDQRPPGGPVTDEHRQFLLDNPQVFLIVRRADGTPMGYPMVGRWENGALEFSTYRKSAKVRHVEADDRVCCVSVPRDRSAESRVLTVWGRGAIGEAGADRWRAALQGRDDGAVGIAVPESIRAKVADRLATSKRIVLRVEIESARFGTRGDRG